MRRTTRVRQPGSVFGGLAAAVVLVVGFGSAAAGASGAAAPKIKVIAVEGPMTGSQASTGIDMARGAQLAVNQINGSGGIDGVQIKLLKVNDSATAAGGLAAAKKVISAQAFAVVGPFNSSVGVANLPLYKRAGLPTVRLTSSLKTEGFGVTTQPMDSQVAPVEIQEISTVLHAQHPAIIFDTSTYTAGIAKQVKSGLAKAGDPVVATVSVKTGQSSYSAAVKKVALAHPDLLYIAAYGAEAGAIAKTASSLGVGRCFVDLAAQGPDFVKAAGQPVASACLSSGVPSAEQFAGASGYVQAYKTSFGSNPGTWGTFTYDSVQVVANAVKDVGWNRKSVITAMAHTTGMTGITGPITIAPATGDRVQNTVVILDVNSAGSYVIDPQWAAAAGFPIPPSGG